MKYVTPFLNLSDKVILVGSSGTLLYKNYGSIIDDHEDVIRFNRAPTEGFEIIAGSRTTLRVANNHVFNNNDIEKDGFSRQPKNFIKDLREQKILYIGPDMGPWHRRQKNTHESCDLYIFEYSKIEQFKSELVGFNSPKQMTVGGIMVGLCIISGIKPTLVGFDTTLVPRTHYYESRPPGNPSHSINEEQQWFLRLEKDNKIKILR